MHLPKSNRGTWIFAAVAVVVAIVVAGFAIHELGKPGNTVDTSAAFNAPTTTTTTTTTTAVIHVEQLHVAVLRRRSNAHAGLHRTLIAPSALQDRVEVRWQRAARIPSDDPR